MSEQQGVSSFPLPPMQYISLYTDDHIKRGRVPQPPPPIQVRLDVFYNFFSFVLVSLKPVSVGI